MREAPISADALIVVAGASLLVWIWVFHTFWPPVAQLKPSLALLGLGIALWVLASHPRRRLSLLPAKPTTYVLGLLGLAVISVPFSVYPGASFDFLTTNYALTVLWTFFLALAVRSERDVRRLLAFLVFGGFGFTVMSMFVSRGDRLAGLAYYDANDLATMLVATLPAAVYFIRGRTSVVGKMLAAGALTLMLIAIVDTGSRGGFLGLVAVAAFVLFGQGGISRKTRFAVVAAGALLLVTAGSTGYWERISTIFTPSEDYNYGGNSVSGRVEVWKRGLGYMVKTPLGVGVAGFPHAEGRSEIGRALQSQGIGFKWSAAHNSFVQVAAELGVGGAFCMIALLGGISLSLKRLSKPVAKNAPPDETNAIAGTLLACLVAFAGAGFFVSFGYSTILYGLLGISLGFLKIQALDVPRAILQTPGRAPSIRGR